MEASSAVCTSSVRIFLLTFFRPGRLSNLATSEAGGHRGREAIDLGHRQQSARHFASPQSECLRCNAAVVGSPCSRFSDRAVARSRRCAAAAAIAECQSEAAAIRRAEGMLRDPANAGGRIQACRRAETGNLPGFRELGISPRSLEEELEAMLEQSNKETQL